MLTQKEVDAAKQADYFGSDWGVYEKDGHMRLWPAAKIAQLRGIKFKPADRDPSRVCGVTWDHQDTLLSAWRELADALGITPDRYIHLLRYSHSRMFKNLQPMENT